MDDNGLIFEKCIAFLNGISIPTEFRKFNSPSFLPGLLIEKGVIIIDIDDLAHPGDILHEAGHIAVVPSADRPGLNARSIGKRKNKEAEEMMAIAWSYAACIHLLIDPYFVFHTQGYKEGSTFITESCSRNDYFGLPMLQSIGLTTDSYPDMIKWLRD